MSAETEDTLADLLFYGGRNEQYEPEVEGTHNSSRRDYINNHNSTTKDNIIQSLIPDRISECALYTGKQSNCADDSVIQGVGNALGIQSNNSGGIIEEAKEKLGCDSEKCVIEKTKLKVSGDLRQQMEQTLRERFKITGPRDTSLLSNFDIDNTLEQWKIKYNDFFPYNFNMLDYASHSIRDGRISNTPDTLATITFSDLYNGEFGKQYKCAACVINSDRYSGRGKHWMALFIDARGDRWTVEFFNSSGNPPAAEWVNWLVKTKKQMQDVAPMGRKEVEIIRSCSLRHQQSKTECGLYSLFYIWARLHKVPPEYFNKHPVPDQLMFEFRHHLFDDPKFKNISRFDFDNYKNQVKISWE